VRESRLPGWTNAHVICHLERNAASHVRLLEAAVAGDLVDQYEGGDAGRQAAIESGSHRPLDELVADLSATNRHLERQWHSMSDQAWLNPTRARAGTRRAYLCLWARWREVELHSVDLDCGAEVDDWPMDFAVAGLDISFGGLELRAVKERLAPDTCVELVDHAGGVWRSDSDRSSTHRGVSSAQRLLGWVVGRCPDLLVGWATGPPNLSPWP
jgi:maleylpyruvate isomerase